MRDRYVKSWPADGPAIYPIDIGKAMARAYTTDAHFVQYTSPHRRRLCRQALDAGAVATINVIVFDLDCPAVHGSKEPAPDAWRAEIHDMMRELIEVHPGPFFYHTRGGCRIIYRQPVPVTIACARDESQWSLDYVITLAYLARRFGLVCDAACLDWTRLFRLPRATRSPGKPECYPMYGDPSCIGRLTFTPDAADVTSAEASHKPRASHVVTGPAFVGSGEGVFFHALRARGDIIRAHPKGHVIRCPRESHHSSGRTGDGSTLLYPPSGQHTLGGIHCLHSHCTGIDMRSWRNEFTRDELDAANRRIGE